MSTYFSDVLLFSQLMTMKPFCLFILLLATLSAPAFAERLNFDHRIYPPLKAVFDQNRKEMIDFDNSKPGVVIDRVAIQGTSASNWTEALDIIVRTPNRDIKTADDWFSEIRAKAVKSCPSEFAIIAKDLNSLTFSRRSTKCGKDKVQFALYRIISGQRSMFLLNAINRADMTAQAQKQWLELLSSAQLAD
jgi:hypothetical protein